MAFQLFTGTDKTAANTGTEIWVTDGTAAGTLLLKDINPGPANSTPANFTFVGAKVFFTANDGAHGTEVWVTDGTAAGTLRLDAAPAANPGSYANPNFLTPATALGSLVFVATDKTAANTGTELWVTDGTAAGTKLLVDINPGAGDSNPANFTRNIATAKDYFTANDGAHGVEVWVTDGTAAGTLRLDAAPAANPASYSNPTIVSPVGAKELFIATDKTAANTGTELWVTDGTAAGTTLLKDINPGPANSTPANFALNSATTKVYFTANDGTHGTEVWVTDGTPAGTLRMDAAPAANPASYTNPTALNQIAGKELFVAKDNTATNTGTELWVTDGTAAGTTLLKDINAGPGDSNPANFAPNLVAAKVFFTANDGAAHGTEVWVTDGTAAGTLRMDAAPAANPASYTNPTSLFPVAAKEIFVAKDNTAANTGTELWVTDGTAAGTGLLKDINVGPGDSNPANFSFNSTGKIFFTANDGTHGTEVWVTDGTAAGTLRMDAAPAANPASYVNPVIEAPVTVGGKELFVAKDNTAANTGMELWVTDGTAAGTTLLKDINTGPGDSNPANFVVNAAAAKVFFTANDGAHGVEEWVTDGTAAGTLRMDAAPAANPASYAGPVQDATNPMLSPASDTGIQGDNITTVTTPVFVGKGLAGVNTVTIYEGATVIATGFVVPGSLTWSAAVTTPLTAGTHNITEVERAGAAIVGISAVTPVTISVASPPTGLALAPGSDSGTKGDNITNVLTPTITGKGDAGDTVTLLDGATSVGTGKVDGTGAWSITTSKLAEGSHTLTATETDGTNTSGASAPLLLTIDATGDPPTGLTLDPASDSGTKGDNSTNVTTPVITGKGEIGAALTLLDGATSVGTATVDATGKWSVTTSALAVGKHTLTATEVDAAGNTSPASAPLVLTIETGGGGGAPIVGTAGDDVLTGTAGVDTIQGLAGNDTLIGLGGADTLDGGDGTDTADYSKDGANGGANSVVADLSKTFPNLDGFGATDTLISIENLTGTNSTKFLDATKGTFSTFGDVLIGDTNANVINGLAGPDYIDGGPGDDTITGDGALVGGLGSDTINGGADNDVILTGDFVHPTAGDGNDVAHGGAGNDLLWGYSGNDTLFGDDGDDSLVGNDFSSPVTGTDTMFGGNGNDQFFVGLAGNATMDGGAGNDHFFGGPGNDVMIGGPGSDFMFGANGADTFIFHTADFVSGDADIIYFFSASDGDTLQFDAASKAGLTMSNTTLTDFQSGASVASVFITNNAGWSLSVLGVNLTDLNAHTVFV